MTFPEGEMDADISTAIVLLVQTMFPSIHRNALRRVKARKHLKTHGPKSRLIFPDESHKSNHRIKNFNS